MDVLITDKIAQRHTENTVVLEWHNRYDKSNNISINNYLDDNSIKVRDLYLEYIHKIGHDEIRNNSLVKKLHYKDNFSFWWLNLVSEKSPFKSKRIFEALRVISVFEIIKDLKPEFVHLDINDHSIRKCFENNFKLNNTKYSSKSDKINFITNKNYFFFYIIKAFLHLIKYAIARLPFSRLKRLPFSSKGNEINVFSYFSHFDSINKEEKNFSQSYWGPLLNHLISAGYKVNWIHFFLSTKEVPSHKKAIFLINYFNKERSNTHQMFESYLSISVILNAILVYFKVIVKSLHSSQYFNVTYPDGDMLSLKDVLEEDFYQSIYGSYGIQNALKYLLFEKMFKKNKFSNTVFYLYENQNWEHLLLFFYKKNYKKGKLIAYQHATVPFWHLYYYNHFNTIKRVFDLAMLKPDIIATNSSVYRDIFLKQGYKSDIVREVEALRFVNRKSTRKEISNKNRIVKRILLLGEYSLHGMINFKRTIEKTFMDLEVKDYDITYKPHPAFEFNFESELEIKETNQNLNDILFTFDLVICTNSTSASIDAILNGVKVFIFLDPNVLNLSPVLNMVKQNIFFHDSHELKLLILGGLDTMETNVTDKFFNLGTDLHLWKNILKSLE